MWVRTVWGLKNSSAEMSSIECPRAICSRTSHSRSDSVPELDRRVEVEVPNPIAREMLTRAGARTTLLAGGIQVDREVVRSK